MGQQYLIGAVVWKRFQHGKKYAQLVVTKLLLRNELWSLTEKTLPGSGPSQDARGKA